MTARAESAYIWYDADVNGYIVTNDDDGDGVVFAQAFAKSGSISHQHDAMVQAVLRAESFGYIVENYDTELGCIERDDHDAFNDLNTYYIGDADAITWLDGRPLMYTALDHEHMNARAQHAIVLLAHPHFA